MILVGLLTCSFATFAKKKLPGMSYLIEGVDRIYIVDESHCSGPTNKEDAGRVYLIEGKEKIEVLKEKFNKWKLDNEYGMCACGGPDKHYYCFREKDQTTYWGVDCDTYLNNLRMPVDLNAIINPKYDTFLGIPTGYALIADVPLEFSEKIFMPKPKVRVYKYSIDKAKDNMCNRNKSNGLPLLKSFCERQSMVKKTRLISETIKNYQIGSIMFLINGWRMLVRLSCYWLKIRSVKELVVHNLSLSIKPFIYQIFRRT